jgi:hypothetical protein
MVAGTVAHPSATPWSRDRAHLPAFRQTCFPIPLSEPAAALNATGSPLTAWFTLLPQSEAMPSQTDSVHKSPGHSSAQLLRPSTGGLPDDLARPQTVYVAFPRSQYYAPSATPRLLQPQVVQPPRDGSQRLVPDRFPERRGALNRIVAPVRTAVLHPQCATVAWLNGDEQAGGFDPVRPAR